jgi:hypothetical protein
MGCYASQAAEAASSNPSTNGYQTARDYIVTNFLGFLGSAAPPLLFTGAMGQVRIDIRFAPSSVLFAGGSSTGTPTYAIGRTYMTCRTLDLPSLYFDLLAKRMSEAPLEIPFTNYIAVTGSTGSVNQTTRVNVSSGSVEAVYGTFLRSDYTTNTAAVAAGNLAPNARTAWYFQRGFANTTDLATSQFSINNSLIAYPMNSTDIWGEVLNHLGGLDTLGGSDEYLQDAGHFMGDFFVHPLPLNVGATEGGDRLLSGVDARGTQLQLAWTTTGGGTNRIPMLLVVTKSVLKVSPGRNIIVEA